MKFWRFFTKYQHFLLFAGKFRQTDRQTHRKSVTVIHTAKTYHTNRQSCTFSSSQREWSTLSIQRKSTTFRQRILIFFENLRTTFDNVRRCSYTMFRQCPLMFLYNVPTMFQGFLITTDEIRRRNYVSSTSLPFWK